MDDKKGCPMKLNLGCGTDIRAGYKNYDVVKVDGADGIIDLNKKLPFKDNSIEEILCLDTIEHLQTSPINVLKEFYRVLKENGTAIIRVPFCRHPSAYSMDHIRYFMPYSFDGIHSPENGEYPHMFRGMNFKLSYETSSELLNRMKSIRLFDRHIGWIFMHQIYMRFLSWFFPFYTITFRFTAIKDDKRY